MCALNYYLLTFLLNIIWSHMARKFL